ncbi:MAG: type II secretion system minor pseudopilin GspI [Steroidobacteraceae bacterium]
MSRACPRGFTLIEVLVALVIVAVGMAALMGALSSSANAVSYMRDKTFAEWVALNQIANLRLQLQQGQVPPTGNTTGDLDYAGRSWHWRQEVVATQVKGMERIDVKVRPAEVKAGDDNGWLVTVSGLAGDAVGAPGMLPVDWGSGVSGLNGIPGNGLTPQPGTTTPRQPQGGTGVLPQQPLGGTGNPPVIKPNSGGSSP